jgi:hypothetical protein
MLVISSIELIWNQLGNFKAWSKAIQKEMARGARSRPEIICGFPAPR